MIALWECIGLAAGLSVGYWFAVEQKSGSRGVLRDIVTGDSAYNRAVVCATVRIQRIPAGGGMELASLVLHNHGGALAAVKCLRVAARVLAQPPRLMPDLVCPVSGRVTIPRNGTGVYELAMAVTADECQEIAAGNKAVYFFGWVDYLDFHAQHRATGFCWQTVMKDGITMTVRVPYCELNFQT